MSLRHCIKVDDFSRNEMIQQKKEIEKINQKLQIERNEVIIQRDEIKNQYCKDNNIKIIYSATSSALGNNGKDENLSPYAWMKSKMVELLKNYNVWFGLKYEISYFFNVYGPKQIYEGNYATVVAIFERQYKNNEKLINENKEQKNCRSNHSRK